MFFLWFIIFCFSLYILIKAADYFTEGAEKIGLALKISPFIVGATIISIGTSLPELATSLIAVFKNQTEIAVANAVGSNITNILLIIGVCAVASGQLTVKRRTIDANLPLFVAAIVLLVAILWDKQVALGEGVIAIIAYIIYAVYGIHYEKKKIRADGILPGEEIPATRVHRYHLHKRRRELNLGLIVVLFLSIVFIYFSADWLIRSISSIGTFIGLPPSLIVLTAMALGTSLPELIISYLAVKKGKSEIALGTIFGSNVFNALIVIGLPSLFKTLTVDDATYSVGLPFLIGTTLLFTFSVLSKRIRVWEGLIYLLIYLFFIAKLFNLI